MRVYFSCNFFFLAHGAGPAVSLIRSDVSMVKGEKKAKCVLVGSVACAPPYAAPAVSEAAVGKPVVVRGYKGVGTLQYFGGHHELGDDHQHCGVVFAKSVQVCMVICCRERNSNTQTHKQTISLSLTIRSTRARQFDHHLSC